MVEPLSDSHPHQSRFLFLHHQATTTEMLQCEIEYFHPAAAAAAAVCFLAACRPARVDTLFNALTQQTH